MSFNGGPVSAVSQPSSALRGPAPTRNPRGFETVLARRSRNGLSSVGVKAMSQTLDGCNEQDLDVLISPAAIRVISRTLDGGGETRTPPPSSPASLSPANSAGPPPCRGARRETSQEEKGLCSRLSWVPPGCPQPGGAPWAPQPGGAPWAQQTRALGVCRRAAARAQKVLIDPFFALIFRGAAAS